jgi:hypothetical protein
MEARSKPSLLMQQQQQKPGEDLCEVMLDNFVDIEGCSVLLVFVDGEQRCHSFPLAARKRTDMFLVTNYKTIALKRQCQEIFYFWFFFIKQSHLDP